MDASTIAAVSSEIEPAGLVDALKQAGTGNWFMQLDACVFSYLLRLLQGQTAKESYLDPDFVRDTIAAYLVEFDCCSTEDAAHAAAARVVAAMDKSGLSQPPAAAADGADKLSVPLTMGREYEQALRKAGQAGGKDKVERYNEQWTWESKATQAKEQRRRRKEEEKKAMLKSEYDEFLRQRGLATTANRIVKVHDKGDAMSSAARAAQEVRATGIHLQMGKKVLVENSDLTLLPGVRYALVGKNGHGKSTLCRALAEGDVDGVSPFLQVVHVEQEIAGDPLSAIGTLLATDVERDNLLKEEKELLKGGDDDDKNKDANSNRLAEVYQRLDEIDAHSAEARASAILRGLSFTHEMMHQPTNKLSGGWRMRVRLATALFVEPDILLLDEPTNHLDLHAVIWLETYLTTRWSKTLVVVSHSRSFLNSVCSAVVHINNKKLDYYTGNYDKFEETRHEKLKNQLTAYETQQAQRAHMQAFVDKFRASAARAKMAQSRIKALEKMEMVDPVHNEQGVTFQFKPPEDLGGPIIQIIDCSFGYRSGEFLFRDVNFSLDSASRVGLVGSNGVGKSTFLKVLLGELEPKTGAVIRNPKARIGYFAQHHVDQLPPQMTPLELMRTKFPDVEDGVLRSQLANFGLGADDVVKHIYQMSGGEKSRVSFSIICMQRPHLLLLDEPTNHLDIDTVGALLHALMSIEGMGVLIVSHDQAFVAPLADQLYVCGGGQLTRWHGEFDEYREQIAKTIKL